MSAHIQAKLGVGGPALGPLARCIREFHVTQPKALILASSSSALTGLTT